VVRVDRRFTHPIYRRRFAARKNYHAHDENNEFKPGDMVWIEESKPISKLKRWNRGPGRTEENGLRPGSALPNASGNFKRKSAHQKEDEVHQ